MPAVATPSTRTKENPRGHDVNLRSAPQMLEYEAIVARIAGDRPGRILDWGCGWGQVTDLLVRAGLEVESFDYRGDDSPNRLVPLERFPAASICARIRKSTNLNASRGCAERLETARPDPPNVPPHPPGMLAKPVLTRGTKPRQCT